MKTKKDKYELIISERIYIINDLEEARDIIKRNNAENICIKLIK